jgi:hypothetical protein
MRATKENIDDLIDEWHKSDNDVPIWEYLGLTFDEYRYWVEKDELPSF